MAVNLLNPGTGEMDMIGIDNVDRGFVVASTEYNASSVDKTFYVAPRAMRVKFLIGRVTVAGTDASAVTAVIRKAPSGTAMASGTALHSGTYDLKGTADTNQTLTLSSTAGVLDLAAGDSLVIDFTGVLTSATGTFSVGLAPR